MPVLLQAYTEQAVMTPRSYEAEIRLMSGCRIRHAAEPAAETADCGCMIIVCSPDLKT